jgi:hypothetical protein
MYTFVDFTSQIAGRKIIIIIKILILFIFYIKIIEFVI